MRSTPTRVCMKVDIWWVGRIDVWGGLDLVLGSGEVYNVEVLGAGFGRDGGMVGVGDWMLCLLT